MRRLLMLAAVVVSMLGQLVAVAPAAEAFPGRPAFTGYFSGIYDSGGRGGCRGGATGGDVFCDGIYPTDSASFLNILWAGLTWGAHPTTGASWGSHNATGAAFIVDTMMGYAPGSPQATVANAVAVFWTEFAPRVQYYESQGWIAWNWTYSGTNVENTFWQGAPGPDDIAWYTDTVAAIPAILFYHPSGAAYIIKKECGNPLGQTSALLPPPPPPDYDIEVTADRNGSPQQVVAGRTYSVGASVVNNGPGSSEGGVMQIMRPAQASLPCAPDCAPGGMGAAGSLSAGGFRNGSGVPGFAGQNWFYPAAVMPAGGFGRGVTQWTVAPGTPVGTTITFNVYFHKASFTGPPASSSITFTVVSERNPGVQGFNADIHAGGGLCGGNLSIPGGQVQGNANATSMGQYVVSAEVANGINNFRSNGAVGPGGDTLKLGQAGNYSVICRPDLVKAATAYRNAGVGYTTNGAGSVDISGLSGVVFLDNPNVHIHGTVNNKLTLVASGNVEIDGTIQINNNSYARADLPSLGVIAEGDIGVHAGVLRVDAYLFANGDIDTCMEANVACANPTPLVVNGFFMAQGILFHRLGPLNTNGAPVAEQVTLNPQIYLNPPRLFDASVDDILLEGQGERRPLF